MTDQTAVVRTIGRYHVLEELGRGAMGVVYRGFDPAIGRVIAIKTIAIEAAGADGQRMRAHLQREAAAAGTLVHPGIVTVFDFIEDSATTAVAMELVEGESLAALIARRGALPIDRALDIFEQIASALDYAGAKGIVHRDVKPANILMTPEGRPKVADFGIARHTALGATRSHTTMGSPCYMSPEQVRGLPLDARSDLFSAAVVFYEMIAGARPFAGDDAATTMYRIVHEAPTPIEQLNPAVGTAVAEVLRRALAKNPAERYASGSVLVAELKRAVGAGGAGCAGATLMTPAAEAPAPPRSPLVMYGLIAVGVITVALVGFVVLGGWPSGPAPRRDAGESVQVPVAAPDVERSPAVRSDRANVPAAPASSGPVSTVPAPAAAPAARPPAPPRASPRPPAPIGGAITPPTKVKDVPPVYPPIAQSARVQGVVMLEVIIGPSGKVTEVKVIRGIPLLDQAAIDAVSQWEYTPTLLAGVAVPVVTTVTVNFALR